jgi:hypothetical protein
VTELQGLSTLPVVRALIDRLELIAHPEGGWYREVWRSPLVLPRDALPTGYPGDRRVMTSIYYLLPVGVRSRLHRVRSEELWLHHQGDDLLLEISETQDMAADTALAVRLGQGEGAALQAVVPPGHWQSAAPAGGEFGYALVGCVVAPGFEFEDFEMVR